MGSAFKDGVDAGLSDFKRYNDDLQGVPLNTDPDSFSNVASIAARAPQFISEMRSGFERIGEKLSADTKSWAEGQKQRLLAGCDGMATQAGNLSTRAQEGLDAANAAKQLRDGDDEEKKSHAVQECDCTGKEHRGRKSIADGSVVEQYTIAGRSAHGKIADEKNLFAQRDAQTRTYTDFVTKLEEKTKVEQDADKALADGTAKDPPLSDSDIAALRDASAKAKQDRETADSDRSNYWLQTLRPTEEAYWAKVGESAPLKQQLSAMKQQRDNLLTGLTKSKTALNELSQEYVEPGL